MAGRAVSSQVQGVPVRHVLGVDIHAVSMSDCMAVCDRAIRAGRRLTIGVVNAAKLVKMRSDPLLRESVAGADLVVADGMAVVWASRILEQPLPERVTGIDLFVALLRLADQQELSIYLLGASPDVLHRLVCTIERDYPKLRICGSHDGYFSDADAAEVVEDIAKAKPQMLFVGISTPKKELFLKRWGPSLEVSVCHGVGGSFDVLAGKTRRAPEAFQRWGFEWLWRLLQEPRRMWRRYLVTNTQFLLLVAREWGQSRWQRSRPPR